jgi:Rps23 Pro-64 3,4-dihydroxylase Tpa1-like proline 4-hydroxylase
MTELTRAILGQEIAARLREHSGELIEFWQKSGPINHFVIDDVMPATWVHQIHQAFPSGSAMTLKHSLREHKYVAAQMDCHAPLLEEAVYAFQEPEVVSLVEQITGLRALEPDSLLYAGGISMMAPGHFLNPHIDNSHDKFRQRYRVLNLLFYVTPDWDSREGCNLELWPQGPKGAPLEIVSRFNRLAVMVTHRGSWHSVSANVASRNRCCVSNYYFSSQPVGDEDYFHVTSFRGRPEQPVRDMVLRADIWLRSTIRRMFPQGIRANPHFYDQRKNGRQPLGR